MDDETIAECGTFTELMSKGGGFADLYKAHTTGEEVSRAWDGMI